MRHECAARLDDFPVRMMEPLPSPTAQWEARVEVRLGPTDHLITPHTAILNLEKIK